MKSFKHQRVGMVGEALAYKQFNPKKAHPFKQHPTFKFIGSTPDFIAIEGNEPVLIECKTFTTRKNAVQ